MGASVRKWQGCALEGDGPPSPSVSTETMAAAAAAAMAMAGLLPTGLRLLWQPPAGEGQEVSRGHQGHGRQMPFHDATHEHRTQEWASPLSWEWTLCHVGLTDKVMRSQMSR